MSDETAEPGALPPLATLKVAGLLSFGEETTFEFGRLNILVGPNGSGKSNLLDVIRVLQCSPNNIQNAFKDVGFEQWLYQGTPELSEATIEATVRHLHQRVANHHVMMLEPYRSSVRVADESIEWRRIGRPDIPSQLAFNSGRNGALTYSGRSASSIDDYDMLESVLSQIRDIRRYPQITRLGQFYTGIRIYSDWSFGRSSALRESTTADRTDSTLSEAMTDLPLALNGLQGLRPHANVKKLLGELKSGYGDFVVRILFGRVGLELTEEPFARPIPAKRLSDGTLRFLALAAICLNPTPPPLVCIEEPELGMHPDVLRVVADMIASASERMQIIITTHSEALITELQDRFDRLFAFDWDGSGTVVRALTQDQYREFRADYPLGELWSSGELGGVRW